MKDILIKGTRIKKEITYWLVSFIIAVVFNIYAIITYNTSWTELISQIHIVFLLSILIYFVILPVRGLAGLFKRSSEKK